LRQVWTDTAEVLIRLGLNQPARQYLHAALVSAREFDEKILQGKILHHLAVLAYKVGNNSNQLKALLFS